MADADSKADKAARREADQLAEVDKYVEEAKVDVGKAEQVNASPRSTHFLLSQAPPKMFSFDAENI